MVVKNDICNDCQTWQTNYKMHKVYCKAAAFTTSQNVSQSFLGSHSVTYQFDARKSTIISKCSQRSLHSTIKRKKVIQHQHWLCTARARAWKPQPLATYSELSREADGCWHCWATDVTQTRGQSMLFTRPPCCMTPLWNVGAAAGRWKKTLVTRLVSSLT